MKKENKGKNRKKMYIGLQLVTQIKKITPSHPPTHNTCSIKLILTHILDILNTFKALPGLTTNVSKTKYALFGNAPDILQITPTTGITIENSPFRLLGITLTGDLKHLDIN